MEHVQLADAWELEFKHRLKQLVECAPWMDVFGLARMLQQQWEGDVSVLMPPRLSTCLMMEPASPSHLYNVAQQVTLVPTTPKPLTSHVINHNN